MPPILRCCFILPFFLLAVCCRSQQSEQFAFTHYRLADGLSSNIVNNIVQDANGFIWLSTNNGLQRFDGNKFITFRNEPRNQYSIPSDEVIQVYIDRQQNFWVMTADNKIGIFDTRTFRYKEVPVQQWSREKLPIEKTFLEPAKGPLLVHFRKTNKLFQFEQDKQRFIPSTAVPFPNNWPVNHLVLDKLTNKYFMATDSGFAVYNPATRYLAYGKNNRENDVVLSKLANERYINYMVVDTSRQLFFEQWPKQLVHPVLRVYNLKTAKERQYDFQKEYGLGYHQIKGILTQKNGKRWVFGLPFLAEFTNSDNPLTFLKKDYNKERDLKFNQIYSMYEDRQRNLWICTDNGVYLFNPDAQLFHNYTLTTPKRFAVEGRAQTALQLPNGEIWLGYRDFGLYRFSRQMRPLPLPSSIVPYQQRKSVWDIHLHSKSSKIWIALQGGKLIVYDTLTGKSSLLTSPAFEQRAITQIVEDKAGNLWFGTQGGNLVKWTLNTGAINLEQSFSLVKKTGLIEKLLIDSKGYLWVGTIGEGLLKVDTKSKNVIAQFTDNSPLGFRLWNNNPWDILQYNDSLLVVASGALNIINLHTHQVRFISNRDGLPSNTVQSLAKDTAGLLWLGTMNGLCVADISKASFTVYGQSDGLLNDQFNVAGAHALQDGLLLFTSAESVLLFEPSFTRKKEPDSKVLITDFKLMNQSLSIDSLLHLKQVTLGYNTTNVVIEFSALNFNRLNKLDYYYQLENFDSTWIKSDNLHQAIYTSLPPGKYRFKVSTKNLSGEFSTATAYLSIRVFPPFWKTWWFFLLVLLFVATVLYLLYRERIKRLVTLHAVRSNIANHLHRDVSSTLNNINVLSQIAKMKADRDITRSKELIDEISGKSYNMMLSMDEILWSIDPGNDTMEKTLQRLKEFARTLESGYGASIDIVVHEKVKDLQLNMKVRHDFFVVCKEVLQFLAHYAHEKNIMVDIDFAWTKILLKILCVDADLDENSLNVQELRRDMALRAEAMQANLSFELAKKDTSIVLSIPIKPNTFLPHRLFGNRRQ